MLTRIRVANPKATTLSEMIVRLCETVSEIVNAWSDVLKRVKRIRRPHASGIAPKISSFINEWDTRSLSYVLLKIRISIKTTSNETLFANHGAVLFGRWEKSGA